MKKSIKDSKETMPSIREVKKMYDLSFPNHKTAWRHLVLASEIVGWKDIYFMILKLQELVAKDTGYKLLKSHK